MSAMLSIETLACINGIKMGIQLGLRKVIAEGDSVTVIKKVRSESLDMLEISPHIRDIKSLIRSFRFGRFSHVNRITNGVADSITAICYSVYVICVKLYYYKSAFAF